MYLWIRKLDWFVPALLITIMVSKLYPEGGIGSGPFSIKAISGIGVSIIFFLYGLRLNIKVLGKSLSNWRLHLLIQSITFIIFPIIALILKNLIGDQSYMWQGVMFLSVMPSTVSSAVVLVSLANGNVPSAIFNSSVSSIAGILLAPLLLGLVLILPGVGIDPMGVLYKLALQILLPITIGIFLNPVIGILAVKYKNLTRYFDQLVILSIVYYSFSQSFHINQFEGLEIMDIIILILVLVLMFIIVNASIYLIAKLINLKTPELITALFCGSTKSLVHGSTIGRLIFAGSAGAGLILLPLLIYHTMQLLISGIMVSYFNDKEAKLHGKDVVDTNFTPS